MAFFEFPHTRTYDNDLGWLIKNATSQEDAIKKITAWIEREESTIADLQQLLDNIEGGIFPEEIANAIKAYIVRNFYDIVGDMIKMVFFGLTDSGYFVAYIPESWDEITFKTSNYDETVPSVAYGHLILDY